jgi:F420-non-reducing hydrogenase iron-sulfur subunit
MSETDFEPRIIGFLCRWCAYAGADLAGSSRLKYPPNMIPIRMMCSSRVDPIFVLKALSGGADGVFVAGCHPGECHYQTANLSTRRRVLALKSLLEAIGINSDRLRLEWISASEGGKFAETVEEFTQVVKRLGPNPLGKKPTVKQGDET